ncbi:ribulose-phosphate 3-epimerase [Buchnera aphidicola (Nipponaphis monzeni)]|uniref:Ribulose-phosphate 3-epimerase n=1 Tax=Buchnera aphidicola (Nipponaphis monzeni) TaxID=2495405 RepID=A0A455TAT7_9GAMM|nr:ribulose-phosphate 3-epimerase [Buchnera aphidicola]BBI01412.1 ribulose-phosphate 3-epimerase [Buchnera aphidicola (Nipponaphis monzeni)]
MKKFLILPSILSADFSKLGEEITKVLQAGGDIIHFDVMDNHYVPNLTIGPMVLKSIKDYNINVQIDVHLMTSPVDNLIPIFADNGANFITFHPESTNHVDRTLALIKHYGCKAGLALNPSTPLNILDYVMDKLDVILLMSVNPGFSCQLFIPSILEKIKKVRKRIDNSMYNILLEVDGGIKISNIGSIAIAGADAFVIGSEIFKSISYYKTIKKIRNKLREIHDLHIH